MTTKTFEQKRDQYLISSEPTLLSLAFINSAFSTSEMHWCNPLPEAALRLCLHNSFCLGLYLSTAKHPPVGLGTAPKPAQIGFARLITDYTTIAYLTDVYVVPEERGKGLGNWLVGCVDEVLKGMGCLRSALLVANGERGERYYEKMLGAERVEQGKNGLVTMRIVGPALGGKVHIKADEAA